MLPPPPSLPAPSKRWIIREACPLDFVQACLKIRSSSLPSVVPQLLWNRGIRNPDEVGSFFEPSYEQGLHDPFDFRNMRLAVDRLYRALRDQESMVVFGDYDADGITGSTVIISTLREIERRLHSDAPRESVVTSYIPHRDKEGYGLQMSAVEALANAGARLIVTVDCGIACVREIAEARQRGIDVIVVDHHQFGEVLPDGILIHPGLPGETYPFKSLAAVGVAWKLACALIHEARRRGLDLPEAFEQQLLDLVAVATITDIVPLVGENRVLEHYGLRALNHTSRLGLSALIERAALRRGFINERDVGFAIGPRINAAGRMQHASLALRLLLAETEQEALELSHTLESLNRARQAATEKMLKEAEQMLSEASRPCKLHVLWCEHWSPALVGLVAGKLSDRYGLPAVAIGKHGSTWIGSGRSQPAYDITAAVRRVGDGLITRAGGHIQACGFSLSDDRHLPVFAERLQIDAEERVKAEDIGPALEVDAVLRLEDVDWPIVESISAMGPFGSGNPEPTFLAQGLEIISSGTVGTLGRHLRFVAQSAGGVRRRFIAFNQGARSSEVAPGQVVDVVQRLSINEWNGNREIQCKVVDFRSA